MASNKTTLTANNSKTAAETKLLAKIQNILAHVNWDFDKHVFETIMNKQRNLSLEASNRMVENNTRMCESKIERKWADDNDIKETKNVVQCFQCRKCFLANRWHNPLDKESKACVHVSEAIDDQKIMGEGYNAVCEAEVSANAPGENDLSSLELLYNQSKEDVEEVQWLGEITYHEWVDRACHTYMYMYMFGFQKNLHNCMFELV